jgi:hypothetical protein
MDLVEAWCFENDVDIVRAFRQALRERTGK